MLKSYLNQQCTHAPRTGTDNRGQPVYGAEKTLACRAQFEKRFMMTATGSAQEWRHVYYLADEVAEGDTLNGKTVTAVLPWAGLGDKVGYKAVV